jgi:NAD dependent epimerase/dehydratase family enzyme
VNLTGPDPVTNAEFNRALGAAMRRPAPWVVPGFAIRALIGEFGQECLLAGQRAVPAVLEASGYTFQHQTVDAALRYACP